MPSKEGGRVGSWWSQREALPRHNAIAKQPNRCLEVGAESEGPHLSSIALLMFTMVWMVSSARPPEERNLPLRSDRRRRFWPISSAHQLGGHGQMFRLPQRW